MLEAFAVSLAHWADIGGAIGREVTYPMPRDAWQEGLRISPLRHLHRRGSGSREKLDMVTQQRARCRGA